MDEKTAGTMTVREAGKKGGTRNRDLHGHDFYVTIGKKGGSTVSANRGPGFYAWIGRKGGIAKKEKYGPTASPA